VGTAEIDPWPANTGVVELPNGTRVRGRGLHRPIPPGPDPTFGVYLLAEPPPLTTWPATWIKWPDFRLPADKVKAIEILPDVLALAETERVEVACKGGRGRTGTALAVLAAMSGVDRADAVDWVRSHYDPTAVETRWQRRWIERVDL